PAGRLFVGDGADRVAAFKTWAAGSPITRHLLRAVGGSGVFPATSRDDRRRHAAVLTLSAAVIGGAPARRLAPESHQPHLEHALAAALRSELQAGPHGAGLATIQHPRRSDDSPATLRHADRPPRRVGRRRARAWTAVDAPASGGRRRKSDRRRR